MPIIPNAKQPEEDQPTSEEMDPMAYRYEGFTYTGEMQKVFQRDPKKDLLVWSPRAISQPDIWSRRATFPSARLDVRNP